MCCCFAALIRRLLMWDTRAGQGNFLHQATDALEPKRHLNSSRMKVWQSWRQSRDSSWAATWTAADGRRMLFNWSLKSTKCAWLSKRVRSASATAPGWKKT